MFGREELEKLRLQKQSLILDSRINRHALQAGLQELRSGAARLSNAVRAPRHLAPLLVLLAPLAGFLLVRGIRRPVSWVSRAVSLMKVVGPVYSLWRTIAAVRHSSRHAQVGGTPQRLKRG